MKKDFSILEVNNRLEFLTQSRSRIIEYFKIVDYGNYEIVDNKKSILIRQEVNENLRTIAQYVREAGISSTIYYSPPPAIGGIAGNLNIIDNIFNLTRFNINPQSVVDILDQTVGVYGKEKTWALLRTVNPFWWLWRLFRKIIHFPFVIFEEVGFNTRELEKSILGKLIKLIWSSIILLGALIPVLNAFGYQDFFVGAIKRIFPLP